VNGYPPIPPEAMDESGNPLKKKRRRGENSKKKSLKKTTLTQMVGEVNLKQTDWKAEIVVHHPRQNSWRINS